MAEPNTRIPANEVEPVAISNGHALANGGTLPGTGPTPAAASLPGGRACADASGSAPRLREEGAEATNPALTELAAVVIEGGAPADGGSLSQTIHLRAKSPNHAAPLAGRRTSTDNTHDTRHLTYRYSLKLVPSARTPMHGLRMPKNR